MKNALSAAIALVLLAPAILAQTAELSGFVRDPTGAVIQNALVKILSRETGIARATKTNESGLYSFPALQPGVYDLDTSARGFKKFSRLGLTLDVEARARVDLTLELGSAEENITVTADTSLVNTNDASVDTVVDRQFVENLPLNGRSFQSLIVLSPGVVVTPSGETGDQGQLSVAGQRAGSNYFTIDGVSANFAASQTALSGQSTNGGLLAFSALGSTNSLVSVDALQEFRLESSTYAPEYGRQSGAQVLLVTRSGTNRFHGTAFDYLRNDAFNGNDWFANSTAQPKPRERQNDFGGVFGGPIVKDKTFFFFSYEGMRAVEPTFVTVDVPSLAARQSAAPNVQAFLNAFPRPNGPSTGFDLSQLAASVSNTGNLDATSIRIDHSLTSRLNLFGRYNHSPSNLTLIAGCNDTLSTSCQKHVTLDTATIGLTASLTPSISSDFHFNYSRARAVAGYDLSNFGGAVIPPTSSLFSPFYGPSGGWVDAYIFAGRNVGLENGQYTTHLNRQINAVDAFEIAHGTHLLKFGFDFRRLTPTGGDGPTITLYYWDYNGNPLPAVVSGAPPDYMAVWQTAHFPQLAFLNFSSFAQDTWKVSPRLTLTYGLRWDYNPPPTEASGNTYALSETTDLANVTLLPQGSPLWHPDWTNFAPRLGASYQLRPASARSTVLRMGFGQFYDLGTATAGYLDDGSGWFPYSLATVYCNYGTGPNCNTGFPYNGAKPPFAFTQPYNNMRAFDPHLKLPYFLEWSVALEQTLSANQAFKVVYLGSAGRRLLHDQIVTDPNPIFTHVTLTQNTGYSNYEGLQLQFQRRLSRGVQALVSYTWSHTLDTNSQDVSDFTDIPGVSPRQDYASSDFDIRHNFSAALTYSFPAINSQNSFVRTLLRNWSVDSITAARTGSPFNMVYSPANPGTFLDFFGSPLNFRPGSMPGQPLYIADPNAPGGKELNPGAFTIPATLQQGSEGRNSIRGFPLLQFDLSLRRQFSIMEHVTVLFRADAFNIFNHPNFANPLNTIGTCVQGVACTPVYGWGTSQSMLNQGLGSGGFYGSGFGSSYQIGGPRSLQLSMKLQF